MFLRSDLFRHAPNKSGLWPRMMNRPTFHDVLEARKTISPYLAATPLHHHAALSRLLDAEVHLKHENHQALGSFKVRGGVNLLAHMTEDERRRG